MKPNFTIICLRAIQISNFGEGKRHGINPFPLPANQATFNPSHLVLTALTPTELRLHLKRVDKAIKARTNITVYPQNNNCVNF